MNRWNVVIPGVIPKSYSLLPFILPLAHFHLISFLLKPVCRTLIYLSCWRFLQHSGGRFFCLLFIKLLSSCSRKHCLRSHWSLLRSENKTKSRVDQSSWLSFYFMNFPGNCWQPGHKSIDSANAVSYSLELVSMRFKLDEFIQYSEIDVFTYLLG